MRDLLTTILDIVGALLLVAALAVLAAELAPTDLFRGLAVAGAGLLAVSWLFDLRRPKAEGRS